MYFPEKFHYFAKLILNLVHAKVFLHLVSADGGEPTLEYDIVIHGDPSGRYQVEKEKILRYADI